MNSIAANPLPYLVRTAWRHAGAERSRFLIYIAMSALAMGVYSTEPMVIGKLLNLLQSAASLPGVVGEAAFLVLLYGGLHLIFWLLHGPSRVIEREVAYGVRTNYQMSLFRMTTALPLPWHKNNHSGEVIDKVNRACNSLNEFLDGSFEVIHILTRFLGSVLILCLFLPYAGAVVVGMTLVVIAVTILFDRVLFKQDQQLNRYYQKTAAAVHDYLTNITTVISLRLEGRAAGEVLRRIGQAFPTLRANIRLNEWKWFVTSMLVSAVITGTLLFYLYRVIRLGEAFQAGTFFGLFEYLRRIGDGFFGFAWKYGQLVTQSSKVRSAEQIVQDYDQIVSAGAAAVLPEHWRKLEIRGLNFAHDDDDDRQGIEFQNLCLCLERGKTVAFVGESGSGKSTLLSLLRLLRIPRSVEVFCDNVVLPHGLWHVAHTTTLIPQDPEIFAETIRFNVTMGVEAADSQVLDLLRQSRFASVLQRLPRGLETNISEKGINLSGGEKQRLALARGLFFAQTSDIILLDESTSSVDSSNERLIYENVLSTFQDRCVVAAIHKLHLLPLFDLIYVFAHGRLIEQGSYHDLVASEGELTRLVRNYSSKKVEADSSAKFESVPVP